MRRPNRNFEVFSMSALDLFASALGVFIIVAIVLFPYFKKSETAERELEAANQRLERAETALSAAKSRAEAMQAAQDEAQSLREALQQAESRNAAQQSRLEQAENELEQTENALEQARIELARTFLIVGIDWTTRSADVDLYVTDPDGNTFFFGSDNRSGNSFPDSGAQLSYDMRTGPGIELWQSPEAKPGRYKVEYKLFSAPVGAMVSVKGDIYERGGRHPLPRITLHGNLNQVTVATFTVDDEGIVTIHE